MNHGHLSIELVHMSVLRTHINLPTQTLPLNIPNINRAHAHVPSALKFPLQDYKVSKIHFVYHFHTADCMPIKAPLLTVNKWQLQVLSTLKPLPRDLQVSWHILMYNVFLD
jgi:hypothetical protein